MPGQGRGLNEPCELYVHTARGSGPYRITGDLLDGGEIVNAEPCVYRNISTTPSQRSYFGCVCSSTSLGDTRLRDGVIC